MPSESDHHHCPRRPPTFITRLPIIVLSEYVPLMAHLLLVLFVLDVRSSTLWSTVVCGSCLPCSSVRQRQASAVVNSISCSCLPFQAEDFSEADCIGSPYAISRYTCNPDLGTEEPMSTHAEVSSQHPKSLESTRAIRLRRRRSKSILKLLISRPSSSSTILLACFSRRIWQSSGPVWPRRGWHSWWTLCSSAFFLCLPQAICVKIARCCRWFYFCSRWHGSRCGAAAATSATTTATATATYYSHYCYCYHRQRWATTIATT